MKGSDNYYIEYKPGMGEILNQIILTTGGNLMFAYAEAYKRDPEAFISTFLKFNSLRMACCLVTYTARKYGFLDELKGKQDFSQWANKQDVEERWKPLLANLMLIIWGVLNSQDDNHF